MGTLDPVRADLLHLTPQALTQAANAGIVKRAQRELAAGDRPVLTLDPSSTLHALFADGTRIVWPPDVPIQKAACSCAAISVCRHRVIAALAHAEACGDASAATRAAAASPGSVDDEALARHVPASLIAIARQTEAQGLLVEVRRTAAGEPCDTARLPAATVRFWAGAALQAARCDCVRALACEHVALGVWAFRKADAVARGEAAQQVRLGDTAPVTAGPARADAPDRAPFDRLAESVLRHGAANGPAALAQTMSLALHEARRCGAVWLDHLLADVETWFTGYADRSALYDAADGVDLLAELALRLAAGLSSSSRGGQAQAALGIGQPGETELDRLRLVCLGARTRSDGIRRRTRLVLADADSGTRLVLSHDWEGPPQPDAQREAALRGAERLAPGVALDALARGQLLARQARRRADGGLRLAKSRSLQNSVLPQAADWSQLGPPLRFDTIAQMAAHQREQPVPQWMPRHASRQFVVFTPAQVEHLRYDPNEQCLLAQLTDADDQAVLLRRTHEAHLRHALDACAAALTGRRGALRHVAGVLSWTGGMPTLEPWAFACDGVLVPDLAEAHGALAAVEIGSAPMPREDAVTRALAAARELMGTLLHHGALQMPRGWPSAAHQCATQLRQAHLTELATRLDTLAPAVIACHADGGSTPIAPLLLPWLALRQLHVDAQAALDVVD